ncbi:hypothetical protein M413DRAFT_446464 [Hebeloma cylindrosporum]|uniref:Uncharacterized protein n=1 Tax=Hebeloma cylindrosporum TaxID=76867 RepID=A0A0C3C7T8_HEBCY|nr:hypothetical protein M413DRAFT_446464 [Hebeloma cylindrosporum h7]
MESKRRSQDLNSGTRGEPRAPLLSRGRSVGGPSASGSNMFPNQHHDDFQTNPLGHHRRQAAHGSEARIRS